MAQDSPEPRDWRGWIVRGVEAFKHARYSGAIPAFQKASGLNPESPIPHLYAGLASFQEYIPGGESAENAAHAHQAVAEFRRALELDAKNWTALVMLGQVAFFESKWDEARQWYMKAQAAYPHNAEIWYTLGVIAWRQYQDGTTAPEPFLEEAISNFQKALALDPEHEDAMTFLSLLLRDRAEITASEAERREEIAAADRWLEKSADVSSESLQATIAGTMTTGVPESAGADPILWQWASLAVRFPPPPPPPPPADLASAEAAVRFTGPAVISFEPRAASDQAPPPIRVTAAVQEQKLITRVSPVYPAGAANVLNTLRFVIVIGKDGRVLSETLVSGNPRLVPAAMAALRQWVYQPTFVHGTPVEVVTEVRL